MGDDLAARNGANHHWGAIGVGGGFVVTVVLFLQTATYVYADEPIPWALQLLVVVVLVSVLLSTYVLSTKQASELFLVFFCASVAAFIAINLSPLSLHSPTEKMINVRIITGANGIWLTTVAILFGYAANFLAVRLRIDR